MIAVIGDSGNTASVRLHRYFQFRNAGTLLSVGFKFDRWVDTVLMQRELCPQSGPARPSETALPGGTAL
jgi:phosphinothricin acetyltransferase